MPVPWFPLDCPNTRPGEPSQGRRNRTELRRNATNRAKRYEPFFAFDCSFLALRTAHQKKTTRRLREDYWRPTNAFCNPTMHCSTSCLRIPEDHGKTTGRSAERLPEDYQKTTGRLRVCRLQKDHRKTTGRLSRKAPTLHGLTTEGRGRCILQARRHLEDQLERLNVHILRLAFETSLRKRMRYTGRRGAAQLPKGPATKRWSPFGAMTKYGPKWEGQKVKRSASHLPKGPVYKRLTFWDLY